MSSAVNSDCTFYFGRSFIFADEYWTLKKSVGYWMNKFLSAWTTYICFRSIKHELLVSSWFVYALLNTADLLSCYTQTTPLQQSRKCVIITHSFSHVWNHHSVAVLSWITSVDQQERSKIRVRRQYSVINTLS